jgi:hypothetical protein
MGQPRAQREELLKSMMGEVGAEGDEAEEGEE